MSVHLSKFENARLLGNVFLAAVKCLTYFISNKTFGKYILVRIHWQYCLERHSQISPEPTTLCVCPGSQEREMQISKPSWSMGGKDPLVHFGCFSLYIVFVKGKGVLIHNI